MNNFYQRVNIPEPLSKTGGITFIPWQEENAMAMMVAAINLMMVFMAG